MYEETPSWQQLYQDRSPHENRADTGDSDLASSSAAGTPEATAQTPEIADSKRVRFSLIQENIDVGPQDSSGNAVSFGFGVSNWRRPRVAGLVGLAVLVVSSIFLTMVSSASPSQVSETSGRRQRRHSQT